MNLIRRKIQNEKGVSLVEMLVGIAILGLIMTGIYTALSGSLKAQQFNFDAAANTQDALQILNTIDSELKNAVSIESPSLNASASAILYKKSSDTTNRIISLGKDSNANTVIFTDPTGKITHKYGVNRTHSLQFTRDSSHKEIITITLTMNNSAKSDATRNIFSTVVYTLNKVDPAEATYD